jgi:7-cyano-7-deazaguanine reductase
MDVRHVVPAMTATGHSPLGQPTAYIDRYDPGLLFAIGRQSARAALGIAGAPPFHGVDVWNAYELSWLDPRGKPRVALAEFRVPAASPAIIESKSLKLYLNGFSGERLTAEAVEAHLLRDLAAAAGAPVAVRLLGPGAFAGQRIEELDGILIDDLPLDIDDFGPPHAEYLRVDRQAAPVEETLRSHLLKSNCPVTGQPDWASVQVAYVGAPIDRAGLLRYLVSFRHHNEFHEQCVERMFMDIARQCAPLQLSVLARYTRRGGLDINPFRSSIADAQPRNPRGARQ